MDKFINRLALILAAAPLLFYPAVLFAGIMGLAAPAGEMSLLVVVAKSFLWMTLFYPIWYVLSAVVAIKWSNQLGALMAICYLGVCAALFLAWLRLSP